MGLFDFFRSKKQNSNLGSTQNSDLSTSSSNAKNSIQSQYIQSSSQPEPSNLTAEEKQRLDLEKLNSFANKIEANRINTENSKPVIEERELDAGEVNAKMAEEYIKIENPFRGV